MADNEITVLEGLEKNTLLEELVLEENKILKLQGIGNLQFLKKLDLGKNKLVKLENLESLIHLTQLSVEDNQIESLTVSINAKMKESVCNGCSFIGIVTFLSKTLKQVFIFLTLYKLYLNIFLHTHSNIYTII